MSVCFPVGNDQILSWCGINTVLSIIWQPDIIVISVCAFIT